MAYTQREKSGKNELKLAVVGSGGVGKSAITIRFVTAQFYDQGYNPTIEDSYRKQVVVNDEAVTLEILDTAGQEEYAAMADQWYKYASGFLLVYSVTDRVSFENVSSLHQDILRVKDRPYVPMIIISNKRTVSQEEGRELAKSFHAPFIECSAAEGVNVDVAFRQLVKLVRKDERRIAGHHAQILAGPISGSSISTPSRTAPTTASTFTPRSTAPSTPFAPPSMRRRPSHRPSSPLSPPRYTRESPTAPSSSKVKKDRERERQAQVDDKGCCVIM